MSNRVHFQYMKRNTLGIVLIAYPIPLLFLTLSCYAVVSFVIASMSAASTTPSSTIIAVGQIINLLLGLTGVIAVIGIPVGIPIGIYLLCTPTKPKAQ